MHDPQTIMVHEGGALLLMHSLRSTAMETPLTVISFIGGLDEKKDRSAVESTACATEAQSPRFQAGWAQHPGRALCPFCRLPWDGACARQPHRVCTVRVKIRPTKTGATERSLERPSSRRVRSLSLGCLSGLPRRKAIVRSPSPMETLLDELMKDTQE